MTLLLDIAPYVPPVSESATGDLILQRFENEPDTLAIAVVDDLDRPVGIVERNAFLVRMSAQFGHALWARRRVSSLMKTDPVMIDGDVTVEELCGRLLEERPSSLLHGFIVTCGGRYAGIATPVALLQASAATATRLAEAAEASSQRAHEALAARGHFLAVMSHEIRTPLNGVLAVAEIVRRKTRDPDLLPFIDTIVESGGVLLRLLNDALDLSRAEASGLALDEEPLLAPRLLDDVRGLWSPQAELKSLRFSVVYDGPPDAWVLGDRDRLRQVLNNLVGNAMKFAAGKVSVRLQVEPEGPCLRLRGEVVDDGPGIPSDRLEAIFAPFQQTEEGVRRGGAGLGLAVTQQIVERMNGQITATNNPHGGACFSFDIPLFSVPPEVHEAPAPEPAERADGWLHVLIADDNATNRLVARCLLEMFGCTSEEVDCGAAAVAATATDRFDLVLMDINMPGMNGVEAVRLIRSGLRTTSQIPVLALTANAGPADASFYRSCGMNGVVEKPVKPEHLLAAISAVFEATDAPPLVATA